MTELHIEEPVAEQADEEAVTDVSEDSPLEEATPATEVTSKKEPRDYLNPDLFADVQVLNPADLVDEEAEDDLAPIKEKYLETISDISEKQVITGRVIGMNDVEVLVDIGFKSEGVIDRSEFAEGEIPKIGDQIDVFLVHIEDKSGNLVLSKEKADFMRRWTEVKERYEKNETMTGKIIRRIKGGLVIDLDGIQAFLPGSQIDLRPVKDFDQYIDQEIEVRIVKLNEARKNIVVSHKVILEESQKEQREALLNEIEVGQVLEGRVKNITDFGVFLDLGGVDGLLHITDLSWGRVSHPSEIVNLDETLTVKVIDFDREKQRISLGLKQLTPHPWDSVEERYPVGSTVKGKVVSMTNYGVFVEIEPGVEGLVHISEMSWTRHIRNPSEIYSMGDEVEAMVLSIDTAERKISLGAKQLQPDPWDQIEEKYIVGSIHKGKVMNLTQFGAFVEMEEGIEGLIHVSDLSWTKLVKHPREILERGQEVNVRVLEVSRESRRIALGLKQVEEDPWPEIIKYFETGKEFEGTIIRILDKGIILQMEMDVEGIIPFGKFSKRKRRAVASQYKVGDAIRGRVMEVKPDDRKVILYSEDLTKEEKQVSGPSDVEEYLSTQAAPAGETLEIPATEPEKDQEATDDGAKEEA
ncbi:MAG: 30S ribosomal protein S1 [Fidelibacterota bacterium]